jgi:hypothetical protein
VTIDDLVKGVNIVLGNLPIAACSALDLNADERVDIAELVTAVANLLYGCGYSPPPTPTETATPTETRADTATPTVTGTPTATPRVVQINIGSNKGLPGGTTTITVSLLTAGLAVAGTENVISFDAGTLDLSPADCTISAGLGKVLVVSIADQDAFTKTVRFDIGSSQNRNAIPSGPLYACTFHINVAAPLDVIVLSNETQLAFAPDGTSLDNVTGADGSVTVSLVP